MARRRHHRRHRRNPHRRVHHRRRRNPQIIVLGGRRRKRHHRGHRRNPGGFKGTIRTTLRAAVPAVIAGAGGGYLVSKVLGNASTMVKIGAKVGLAIAAGMVLRKRPAAAYAAMGGVLGSIGFELGTQAGGGVVASSKAVAMQEMAMLVRADPRVMSALVTPGGVQTVPSLSGTELPAGADYSQVSLG